MVSSATSRYTRAFVGRPAYRHLRRLGVVDKQGRTALPYIQFRAYLRAALISAEGRERGQARGWGSAPWRRRYGIPPGHQTVAHGRVLPLVDYRRALRYPYFCYTTPQGRALDFCMGCAYGGSEVRVRDCDHVRCPLWHRSFR